MAERTKFPVEEIRKLFLEAHTKTPEEAKEIGLIQEVKDVKIPDGAKVFAFVSPAPLEIINIFKFYGI
jgi:hypothetical protein